MAKKSKLSQLKVSNLGPVRLADLQFGNLTVLVGPQASGKSVILQTLKLILDHRSISSTLRREGYDWQGQPKQFAELFYGEGMENLWTEETEVFWLGKPVTLSKLAAGRARSDSNPSLFYIPAHRVITLKNGWPRHFGDYSPGDPYVVQDFSERLRMLMEAGLGRGSAIFPQGGRLTEATRTLLKRGIFGDFELKQELSGLQKRLVLQRGKEKSLPFMVWSAGQREFSPLLLGLYHLMPAGAVSRRQGVEWVVLEEPEMGLHPRAITAVLFLVLELLHRGYRVCMSTHSPHVLDLLWALRVLIEKQAGPEWVLKLFDVGNQPKNKQIAASILAQDIRVHYLDREESHSLDISRLDSESESLHETNWGGLTEFSARAADVVADFVANHS